MRQFSRPKPPVKAHRNSPRRPGRFGAGILPFRWNDHVPFTQADLDAACQMFNIEPSDADWSRMADEAATLDRYTHGWL